MEICVFFSLWSFKALAFCKYKNSYNLKILECGIYVVKVLLPLKLKFRIATTFQI